MIFTKRLLSAVLAICLLGLGAFFASPAAAHTPAVQADCDQLSVTLASYNASGTNRVVVTINGDVVEDATFGTSFSDVFDAPNKYASYHYTVAVTAHDDPTGSKGWTKTFTGDSRACQPPSGGHTPVNVCHATNSDSNPYVFITVDADSTKLQGHLAHRNTPNKTWKSAGVFRGKLVQAGDPKPDLIGDYTDKGVKYVYDGVITSKSDCGILTTPVQPSGQFTTECTATGAQADIGTLSAGSFPGGTFQLVSGQFSVTVTSGQQNVTVPANSTITLQYVRQGDQPKTLDTESSPHACPPVVQPSGQFTTECTATGAQADIGTLSAGSFPGGTFQLVSGQFSVTVTSGQQNVTVPANSTITLQYVRQGDQPKTLDTESSPHACPPVVQPSGQFTTECTATGAQADIGTLSAGSFPGGTFQLVSGQFSVTVTSGQQDVTVPANSTISLQYVRQGDQPKTLDTESSPHACPPVVQPSGQFTTECTATGAQADIGTLSAGSFPGGTFQLVSGQFSVTVTSGQQDVTVPASSTIALQYLPPEGATKTLDTEQSPAACPPPPPTGDVVKTSVPATGSVVPPGSTIAYTVTVSNTGTVPIVNAPVVDTLPTFVTPVAGTVSDSGVISADGRTITWTVSLPAGGSKAFTYTGLVGANAPPNSQLVNKATFLLKDSTTTHAVGSGALSLTKAVSPVAGNGVVVEFGDTLTYTLTAAATGTLSQPKVVITDYLPGRDPARPSSGKTRYVAGSAACVGAGTCTVTGPDANGLITWSLGDMAPGTSRQVTFKVVIVDVAGEAGETVAVDILNAGAVKSDRTPVTPSNEVVTPVTKVLGTKTPQKPPAAPRPSVLPNTGTGLPLGATIGGGLGMVAMGLLLTGVSRRRRVPIR